MSEETPIQPQKEKIREINEDLILRRIEEARDLLLQSQGRIAPILDNPIAKDETKSNLSLTKSSYDTLIVQFADILKNYSK